MRICPQCGSEYGPEQSFCSRDGSVLHTVETTPDLTGRVVADRYRVVAQIGEGGMGRVYRADHVRIGRPVALKVLRPGMLGDAEAIARFVREATNASRIDHPNVAAVYDFGDTADGLTYLAMEYVDGEPLSALLHRGAGLTPGRIADIVRQVADGLFAAHELGIVHRDLKPDNVMIASARRGGDQVKVVDFGVAKVVDATEQKVTISGVLVGTPAYMSPEQVACEPLDGRSDQYTLALMAVKLLTGELPFPGNATHEIMTSRLTATPRRLRDLRPDVHWPARLQEVLNRAMAMQPAARFETVVAFAEAFAEAITELPFDTAMDGTVVVDRREGSAGVAATRRRRAALPGRPVTAAAGLALLAAVAAWAAAERGGRGTHGVARASSSDGSVEQSGKSSGSAALAAHGALRYAQTLNGQRQAPRTHVDGAADGSTSAKDPPRWRPAEAGVVGDKSTTPLDTGALGQSARSAEPPSPSVTGGPLAAHPSGPAPSSPSAEPNAAEIGRLKTLSGSDDDERALSSAVALSSQLLARTTAPSDSLLVLYYRARALAFLERTSEACEALSEALRVSGERGLTATVRATKERLGCM